MKNTLLLIIFFCALSIFTSAQTIRDDGKITKRESRYLSRKVYGSDRQVRLHEWKDSRKIKKAQVKQAKLNKTRSKRIQANKKDWGTPHTRKSHAKHYKAMKKGWLARDNSRKYVKETRYP